MQQVTDSGEGQARRDPHQHEDLIASYWSFTQYKNPTGLTEIETFIQKDVLY